MNAATGQKPQDMKFTFLFNYFLLARHQEDHRAALPETRCMFLLSDCARGSDVAAEGVVAIIGVLLVFH